jgi:hypothetical protein
MHFFGQKWAKKTVFINHKSSKIQYFSKLSKPIYLMNFIINFIINISIIFNIENWVLNSSLLQTSFKNFILMSQRISNWPDIYKYIALFSGEDCRFQGFLKRHIKKKIHVRSLQKSVTVKRAMLPKCL